MSAPAPAPITPDDLITAARTVYGEARGESWEGKLAVACVIVNRLRLGQASQGRARQFGATLGDVCLKPFQFSCWLDSDPNRAKLLAARLDDPLFLGCLVAVADALRGVEDATRGATHYVADWLTPKPAWMASMRQTARIGRHIFLTDQA